MASQDMPPPGGFGSIVYERIHPKVLMRQGVLAAIVIGLTINGFRISRERVQRTRVFRTEQTEHYIATWPFLLAEQDRGFLLHLRNLRDEEKRLMKDHEGWKLGTLYGEPVFKTQPKDTIPPINPHDFIAHTSYQDFESGYVMPDFWQ